MNVVFILLGFLLLVIGGVVWAGGAPKRAAKRMVGVLVSRARPLAVDGRRWLVAVDAEGKDRALLHEAFMGFGLAGDMAGALLGMRLNEAARTLAELPTEAQALGDALRGALAPLLAKDGLELVSLQVLGGIDLDDPAVRNLGRYVATECAHTDAAAMQSCKMVDIYLDGVSGRGDWAVECAKGYGAAVQRVRSVDLLRRRDYLVEVTVDGKSVVENRTLAQMLDGK